MEIGIGSFFPILPTVIVGIGGLLILVLDTIGGRKGGSGRGFMAITVLFLLFGLVASVLQLGADPQVALTVVDIGPFTTFLQMLVYISMVLVALAGGGYLNKVVSGPGEFWSSFLFVTVAMVMAVSANNLLLIFVAIEFLSITSYILVGSIREDLRSSEAGLKYFLYGSVASGVMLYGMSLLYGGGGSLNLIEIGQAFVENPDVAPVLVPAAVLLLVGLGFKTSSGAVLPVDAGHL